MTMDVSVTGRHCTITDSIRDEVTSRVTEAVEQLQDRVIRTEVEFSATEVKGDPDQAIRCEITVRGRGPVVRATGTAQDKTGAFDMALDKLRAQLRKAADRRKHRHGLRGGPEAAAGLPAQPLVAEQVPAQPATSELPGGLEVTGEGPLVVREKVFPAVPLSLAQALDEMELVGHDFFLYVDAETGAPSVVYRRHAYDFGVIHLDLQKAPAHSHTG